MLTSETTNEARVSKAAEDELERSGVKVLLTVHCRPSLPALCDGPGLTADVFGAAIAMPGITHVLQRRVFSGVWQ